MTKIAPLTLTLQPIGVVKNRTNRGHVDRNKIISKIVVNLGLEEGLEGLTEFSHLIVLVWMHHIAP